MKPLMRGVDLSHWNGNVDFNVLKKNGVSFAILKAGGDEGNFYKDSKYNKNYNLAKQTGMNVGAYYFVGRNFTCSAVGLEDAKHFISLLKGKVFEMPVIVDIEVTPFTLKVGATEAAIAFCRELEKNGYYAMIYSSDISGFKSRLNIERLVAFDKWVARYGSQPVYVKEYGMWQYSSKGTFPGHKGNFDLNYAYKNYPEIMKRNHLNGW